MTVKDDLPDQVLDSISHQIGMLLPGLLQRQPAPPVSVALAESFEVWTLDLPKAVDALEPLAFPVRKARYWHHQVLFDGEVKAHAKSQMSPSQQARVLQVSISPLAKKIDAAIEWVESPEREWATSDLVHVQLLAVESLLIYTFRLVEPKKVYVIDAFPGFVNLQPGQLLDEVGFLAALYSDLRSQKENYGDTGRR